MRAYFIRYPKESLGYYFYLSKDHNMIVSQHAKFLKRDFIQDGGNGSKIQLKESISKEQRAIEPVEPVSPCRSIRISRSLERYTSMLIEYVDKIFFMGDMGYVDDPKTYTR